MKKIILFSLISISFLISNSLYAAETYQLGKANFALKADSISFSDELISNLDVDNGFYGGLEFYLALAPDGYLGIESGYAFIDSNVSGTLTELTFIPVEINLKGSLQATPNLVFDVGVGIAGIYVDALQLTGLVITMDDNDSAFGGQVFLDMNYVFGNFIWGLHGKYQLTSDADFNNVDYNFSNFRVGTQIGFRF